MMLKKQLPISLWVYENFRFSIANNQNGGNQGGASNQGFLNWMNQGQGQDGQWPRAPPQQPQDKGFLKYD